MSTSEFTMGGGFPAASYEAWRELVERELNGASFDRKLVTRTYEGIALQPLYTDRGSADRDRSGFPGMMPYVRGSAAAVPAPPAQSAQERREPDLSMLRSRITDDLELGVDCVELRFDRAARSGLDADEDGAEALVGVDGACLYSCEDLAAVLDRVAKDGVAISLEPGATFLPAAALLYAWRRRQGHARRARGAFNADPLAVLAGEGELPTSLSTAFDQLAVLASWTSRTLPDMTSIRVKTAVYHQAGATAARDLGLSLATGVEYLRQLELRGVSPGVSAQQMVFSYALGTRLFMAIAKLRAARLTWARVLAACGVDEAARGMTIHAEASRRVVTRRDPWVNMLRNTVCCFAATVGGANVIGSLPFDAALGLPGNIGRRVACNTLNILKEEVHLDRVVDAAGGSWLIEDLTQALAEQAWTVFQDIERRGGLARALAAGWVRQSVAADLESRRRNVATRRDPIVGVSEYPSGTDRLTEPVSVDLVQVRAEANERVNRRKRDTGPTVALAAIAAHRGDALVEALIDAAQAGATVGQLWRELLRQQPKGVELARLDAPIVPHALADPFERLRDAVDRHVADGRPRPKAFLANVGLPAHYTARADYARSFFEVGGFDVVDGKGGEDFEALVAQFEAGRASFVVICSSDSTYQRSVAGLAPAFLHAGARQVVLAGNPGEHEAAYRAAGVDCFVYVGCDVVAVLSTLLERQGVMP